MYKTKIIFLAALFYTINSNAENGNKACLEVESHLQGKKVSFFYTQKNAKDNIGDIFFYVKPVTDPKKAIGHLFLTDKHLKWDGNYGYKTPDNTQQLVLVCSPIEIRQFSNDRITNVDKNEIPPAQEKPRALGTTDVSFKQDETIPSAIDENTVTFSLYNLSNKKSNNIFIKTSQLHDLNQRIFN